MIEVVPTTVEHVLELRHSLREEDASEICKFGLPIRKALYRSFRNSILCRTGLVDGRVGAIWGVSGVVLGDVGNPWFLTGKLCDTISPLAFAILYRQQVREMLTYFDKLENYVDSSYTKSVRLLELVGFTLDEPVLMGLKTKVPFRRFWKRSEHARN